MIYYLKKYFIFKCTKIYNIRLIDKFIQDAKARNQMHKYKIFFSFFSLIFKKFV